MSLITTLFLLLGVSSGFQGHTRPTQPTVLWAAETPASEETPKHGTNRLLLDRRQACLAPVLASFAALIQPACAETPPDFLALSDLPPLKDGHVRIFLCRHGQTENNRLKLIQGARIDPPLNDNGIGQATRLGKALNSAVPVPEKMFHSRLKRAQQTALLASRQIKSPLYGPPPLDVIPELAEIDFGSVEGVAVESIRSKMVATYGKWAIGEIEARMSEDGENFDEILVRVKTALAKLTLAANSCESRCVAAVAHSSYIRILLAVVQDLPLLGFTTMEQKNACVNVIDFNMDGSMTTLRSTSSLFGGLLSQAPGNFSYQVPEAAVIRTNEKRHLGELAL